jgi:hypothetical protein
MGGVFPFPRSDDVRRERGGGPAADRRAERGVARRNRPILSPAKAASIIIRGIEKDKLHIYVGPDSRLMSLAIKVAPRPAIRFVKKQMSKRLPASHTAPMP